MLRPLLCPCCCCCCCCTVGGIIGFALVFGGRDGVVWYAPANYFPFIAGIVPVIISWFLSPLLAGLITLIIFLLIRTFVLRRAQSTKIAFWVLPILICLTFFINLFFILVSAARVLSVVGVFESCWLQQAYLFCMQSHHVDSCVLPARTQHNLCTSHLPSPTARLTHQCSQSPTTHPQSQLLLPPNFMCACIVMPS
jgi:phosphate/sulfate permease